MEIQTFLNNFDLVRSNTQCLIEFPLFQCFCHKDMGVQRFFKVGTDVDHQILPKLIEYILQRIN